MNRGAAVVAVLALGAGARAEPGEGEAELVRWVGTIGEPRAEGLVVDGDREGEWLIWHPSGHMFERVAYLHGREHGASETWDDEGRLVARGSWRHGRAHGWWSFHHEGGEVASEGAYVDGVRQGPWTERFDDGRVFRVRVWRGGELAPEDEPPAELWCRDFALAWRVDLGARTEGCLDESEERVGLWRGFHGDGGVAWERTYAAGLLDEEAFDYHPGGALLHRGAFRIGAPDGLHVWSATDGAVLGTFVYETGTGPWRAFHPDGAIAEEGAWQGYRREGLWRAWDADGRLVSEVVWEGGEPVLERTREGALTVEGRLAAGLRDGTWSARDDDGRLVWRGDYHAGLRSGAWVVGDAELAFEDDEVVETRRRWSGGEPREERTRERRIAWWPDGVALADEVLARAPGDEVEDALEDALAAIDEGRLVGDDAMWEQALIVQAWLLADPRPRSSLVDATRGPERAARASSGEPDQRPAVPAEGPLNEDGDPHGLWTYYHDNGARQEHGWFDDGVRIGRWRGWDRDGRLAWEGTYVADRLEGPWRTFRREAAPAIEPLVEGRYVAGERDGTWTWYHPNGGVRTRGAYVRGRAEGAWRGFDAAGALAWEASFRRGERVGSWRFFTPGAAP